MTEGEQAALKMRTAAARALNLLADQVAALSIQEAPIAPGGGTLRGSCVYPANDEDGSHTATEDDLTAMVSYNTVYAAAQHEGEMTYERNGATIHWKVEHHTEPGTKTHYLEDPYKAMLPRIEPFVAAMVRAEFDK